MIRGWMWMSGTVKYKPSSLGIYVISFFRQLWFSTLEATWNVCDFFCCCCPNLKHLSCLPNPHLGPCHKYICMCLYYIYTQNLSPFPATFSHFRKISLMRRASHPNDPPTAVSPTYPKGFHFKFILQMAWNLNLNDKSRFSNRFPRIFHFTNFFGTLHLDGI